MEPASIQQPSTERKSGQVGGTAGLRDRIATATGFLARRLVVAREIRSRERVASHAHETTVAAAVRLTFIVAIVDVRGALT